MNKLIVVGAGPKGLAIATKNKVLKSLGINVPDVILIEKNEVASHWTGRGGYTNGNMTLGTGPEKDVGFPYDTKLFSEEMNHKINRGMMEFSWMSYLIKTGKYSDYIDRGRPFPKHKEYANYLRWVLEQVSDSVELIIGEVTAIDTVEHDSVKVIYNSFGKMFSIIGQGLVMTGPGLIGGSFPLEIPGVFDIEKFWMKYRHLDFSEKKKVAIVGAGENSASIALALGEVGQELDIDIIVPSGFIFSRGESFYENRVYSDPEKGNWDAISTEDKLNFIKRTDLGVFGQYAQSQLNDRRDINIVPGRVNGILQLSNGKIAVKHDYGENSKLEQYDYVILATGLDQLKLMRKLSSFKMQREICEHFGISTLNQKELEPFIGPDMALEMNGPKIHLPMISRLRQGPGFANLSSLGRLSDHILFGHINLMSSLEREEEACAL